MCNSAGDLNGSNSETIIIGAAGDASGRCCTCTSDFGTLVDQDCLAV